MVNHLTLFYKGPLRSNGDRKHKHALRQEFHRQLAVLWDQEHLQEFLTSLKADISEAADYGLQKTGLFTFMPLVTRLMHQVAELKVTMLRPGLPGKIMAGGDIDNRLKTLLDSLKVPSADELPKGAEPPNGEDTFFCLLEDDSLVTALSVRADEWLVAPDTSPEVVLLIDVSIEQTSA